MRGLRADMADGLMDTCPAVDRKGLRCEREAGHEALEEDNGHKRYAVEGEAPYLPGPNNSIVGWPVGPPPPRAPIR